MKKVTDLIYKPGARRGDLLKGCLGLFIKEEFSSVVFHGKRRWGMWKECSGYLEWPHAPHPQWLLRTPALQVLISGELLNGPKLMNSKAQSDFVHHRVARQQDMGWWRGLSHTY